MPKTVDGDLDDEAVRLLQKGLYVEPIKEPVDLNKFPADGHEYIHRVRHEVSLYFPETSKNNDQYVSMINTTKLTPTQASENVDLNKWKRQEAYIFSYIAIEIKTYREQLKKKFEKQKFPPLGNEKEWCLFCLGSELYEQIYNNKSENNVACNFPLLSIVLHLEQKQVEILLQYMCGWFNQVGMNHELCRWMYALLACLLKPLSKKCAGFLEVLYDDCVKRGKVSSGDEKYQVHLISAILKNYFCIKAYQIGPSVDRFHKQ